MVFIPRIMLTACVYHHWIRGGRILPAADSIRTAAGYSFPSGHTSTSVPRQLLQGIKADVDAFTGEAKQFDDLTMLCMSYKGR